MKPHLISKISASITHLVHKRGNGGKGIGLRSQGKIASDIKAALRDFNCQYEESKDDEGVVRFFFDYQNGHFVIRLATDSSMCILFPSVMEDKLDNLGAIRSLINRVNFTENLTKLCYTYDEDRNQVQIHVSASMNTLGMDFDAIKGQLAAAMSTCFAMRDVFVHLYNGLDDKTRDYEDDSYMLSRENKLMKELEMSHAENQDERYSSANEHITLEQFVTTVFGGGISITGVKVIVDDTVTSLTSLNEINYFDLLCPVIDYGDMEMPSDDGRPSVRFSREHALVIVDYKATDDLKNPCARQIILNLNTEGHTERYFYVRISGYKASESKATMMASGHSDEELSTCSILVAYDIMPAEVRKNEAKYLMDEAHDKLKSNSADDLSPEQQMLCRVDSVDVGYDLYQGRQAFLDGRYYQALSYFNRVFTHMSVRFKSLDEKEREAFFSICYYIGFCYCELRQYHNAYYYLDLVYPLNKLGYTSEYINCLVNLKDFRSIMAIDTIMKNLEENKSALEDDELAAFMGFLKRRKAYALIDIQDYDGAETILKKLLDEPESQDFAIGELSYLQRVHPSPSSNPEDDAEH